jgi:hypothetical protein
MSVMEPDALSMSLCNGQLSRQHERVVQRR